MSYLCNRWIAIKNVLCVSVLIDLIDYLESWKRQSIMTRILGKKRILTTMLDHERALQESFNVLQVSGNQVLFLVKLRLT